jgi:hypothetical protein
LSLIGGGEQVNIYVIFAQRIESYEGQYAPEALEVMDEYGYDENAEWLESRLEPIKKQGDIVNAKIFKVDLGPGSTEAIRKSLLDHPEIVAIGVHDVTQQN